MIETHNGIKNYIRDFEKKYILLIGSLLFALQLFTFMNIIIEKKCIQILKLKNDTLHIWRSSPTLN